MIYFLFLYDPGADPLSPSPPPLGVGEEEEGGGGGGAEKAYESAVATPAQAEHDPIIASVVVCGLEIRADIGGATTMFLDDEAHCCQREFRSEKECCWLPPGCVTMFMFIVTVFGYGLGVMLSTILFWTIDFIQKE